MARYKFLCDCGIEQEVIMPMVSATFEDRVCSCGGLAVHVLGAPAIMTGNTTPHKTPLDVAVGKDADSRWKNINDRQALRDKVRQETGSVGLSAVGNNKYVPVSEGSQKKRRKASEKLSQSGGVAPSYSKEDAKLIR